jgi:hypothetical protein
LFFFFFFFEADWASLRTGHFLNSQITTDCSEKTLYY